MDIWQVLQTIGICVGALALVAIAVMLFFIFMTFVPLTEEVEERNLIMTLNSLGESSTPRRKRTKKTQPPSSDKLP